ncbi:MAG: DUF3846 domain-containing protein [Erysipelotrichaceae bacterium]|nr:DUF3846 domain-containing protein [Erysipelotrichaceae bacterium]
MKIKGLLIKPDETPSLIEFEESLENLQRYVGGNIEIIQPFEDDDVDVIINEEGKLNGLPLNRLLTSKGNIIDALMGDILIVGANNETGETISIPKEKIGKYTDLFRDFFIEI